MKNLDLYTLIRVREKWDAIKDAATYQGAAPVESQFTQFIEGEITRQKHYLLTSGEEREA